MMRVLRAADDVRLVRDLRIPMRDGTLLAADLYVPSWIESGAATFPETPMPVVVDYIPYRKDEVDPAAVRHYLELPRRGYVVARVDIRGTGGSEGHAVDEYVEQEQLDGYDVVEWIAAQPWCDGHVNLMGISYGGFTALQVATLQPPHLTSIIPVDFTDDRYTDDCHYRGGLLRLWYDLTWYGTRMIAWNAMPPVPGPRDADADAVWARHIAEDEPYLLAWLRHQVDGPYWRQGSVAGITDRITCPVFLIGGWRDGYPNPPLRLFAQLSGPRKLLIGPWDHRYPDAAIPGPRIDHLDEVVRWLDHWCRGADTGIMDEPPIAVYMQETGSLAPDRLDSPGRWRGEVAWPAPGATERTFALAAGGTLVPGGSEVSAGHDQVRYDPTVGLAGGLWSGGLPFGLPGDQRPDEARSLVFTSAPLDEPLSILGHARAVLSVSSSAAVIGVAVSLADVAPDGASHLIAKGMRNLTRRESLTDPEPLTPGEIVTLEIEIDATGWRFEPGHHVRVSIAAADFPNVWPTPEAGALEVWYGTGRDARLILPVVPDEGSATAPVFAPSPLSVRSAVAAGGPTWRVNEDVLTGRTRVAIGTTSAVRTPEGVAIEREFGGTFDVHSEDPADVVAHGWHVCRSTLDGDTTAARSDVRITSSADTFDVTIDLVVTVDGVIHATRRWDESIPRHLL